jgi:hypothetical protein
LDRYLGEAAHAACGRCSACSSDLSATESTPPQGAARRAVVQEFSVRGVAVADASAPLPAVGNPPLTAKMADFGAAMPRVGR